MKYAALTFDDGRSDNFSNAMPIMIKNTLKATMFVTTGYIDGSWQKDQSWKSTCEPMTVEQLKELRDAGFELALHGDKHTTDIDDFNLAYKKFQNWGLCENEKVGFSIPTSCVSDEVLTQFKNELLGSKIEYIRTGRKRSTAALSSKLLFASYSLLKLQCAYNQFNFINTQLLNQVEKDNVFSVVIRCGDDPKMIFNFLDKLPDNTLCVLMLHSILEESDPLYAADPWCYSKKSFDALCSQLSKSDIQCDCLGKILRSL